MEFCLNNLLVLMNWTCTNHPTLLVSNELKKKNNSIKNDWKEMYMVISVFLK